MQQSSLHPPSTCGNIEGMDHAVLQSTMAVPRVNRMVNVQLQLLCYIMGAVLWFTAAPAVMASATAMLQAGDAAYGSGDFSSAIRYYSSALDIDSSTPLFYTKRAAAYISLKKYTLAMKDLDRALEQDGAFTQGYLHRGKLHR